MTDRIHLTLYRGARAPVPIDQADFESWWEVIDALADALDTEADSKVDLLAIAPHRLREPYRSNDNVEAVTLIALDLDGVDLDAVLEALRLMRVDYFVYTSPSDDPAGPSDQRRARVLVRTHRELTVDECAPARVALAHSLGLGPHCGVREALDPARVFFIGRLTGTPPRQWWAFNGGKS